MLVGMPNGKPLWKTGDVLTKLLLLLLNHFSCVQLCATPQTAAHQAPPSLGFSRQEHWSGLPFPSPMEMKDSSRNHLEGNDLKKEVGHDFCFSFHNLRAPFFLGSHSVLSSSQTASAASPGSSNSTKAKPGGSHFAVVYN